MPITDNIRTHWKIITVSCIVLSIFLFLRLYRLPQSLEFYADIGRDHYTLLLMKITGKPTLLGPSISFLPLNQSPWYFYLMYPVFLFSNASPYTSVITLLLLYTSFFVFGMYVYRKNALARHTLLVSVFLVSIHTIFIEQHRFPWNPSFVTPFLLMSLCAAFFTEGKMWQRILAFTLGISFAIGMSYSIVPTAAVLGLYGLWIFRKHWLLYFGSFAASILFVFGPLLLFEVKHQFFFIRRLLMEEAYIQKISISYSAKLSEMVRFLKGVGLSSFWEKVSIVLVLMGVLAVVKRKVQSTQNKFLFKSAVLTTIVFILTLLAPFIMLSHYMYGVLTLLFFSLSFIRKRFLYILLLILFFSWITKASLAGSVFRGQKRSIADLQACAQIICSQEKDPLFVTVSAWYDFHFAPDHLFFMNKAGCDARDITQNPGYAQKLAVVIDNGRFEFGKSAFNELTLFGAATPSATYQCPGNMSVQVLSKID